MAVDSPENIPLNRWRIAAVGAFIQIALGTVYAWSYFQQPIMAAYHWSNTQTAWAFSLAIFFLGVSAAWGGMQLARIGPRRLAMSGGLLYALGYLVSAWALRENNLILFYVGYGVIGGIGLGLGYVTPVATVARWFPDKKGLATGMVVMGFGLGALFMAKIIAPLFMHWAGGNISQVFLATSLIMAVMLVPAGYFLVNPPAGFQVAGHVAAVASVKLVSVSRSDLLQSLKSRQFVLMWLVFFLNITAGIMFIGFQSPLLQDLLGQAYPAEKRADPLVIAELASAGATLIAISSLCNGVGRFLWGGVSDRLGRITVFRWLLATQALIFIVLMFTGSPLIFSVMVCYILLCYGGGFGTMPSFVLDTFGAAKMAVVYGAILTAWSAAGILGPQVVAFLKDHFAESAASYTFMVAAVLLMVGWILAQGFPKKSMDKVPA